MLQSGGSSSGSIMDTFQQCGSRQFVTSCKIQVSVYHVMCYAAAASVYRVTHYTTVFV